MARRRKPKSRGAGRAVLAVAALAALGVAGWFAWTHRLLPTSLRAVQVPSASTPATDPRANAPVTVEGTLQVGRAPRDPELGVEAPGALALIRTVQLRQWQEHCAGNRCDYALEWSAAPIDSRAFREPEGHANDAPFPFRSARFDASGVRLGGYEVEPALAARDAVAIDHPVDLSHLPPNLAATFRAEGGALTTGDPRKPVAGDLRVGYRVVPAGARTLTAVPHGRRLGADH